MVDGFSNLTSILGVRSGEVAVMIIQPHKYRLWIVDIASSKTIMRGGISCPLWSYQCNSGLPNFFDKIHEDICAIYYLTSKPPIYPAILREDFRILNHLKWGDLGGLVVPDEHGNIGMGHSRERSGMPWIYGRIIWSVTQYIENMVQHVGHIHSWTSASTIYGLYN